MSTTEVTTEAKPDKTLRSVYRQTKTNSANVHVLEAPRIIKPQMYAMN